MTGSSDSPSLHDDPFSSASPLSSSSDHLPGRNSHSPSNSVFSKPVHRLSGPSSHSLSAFLEFV